MSIRKEQICIIGSGQWATAIATIIGQNAARLDFCNSTVRMWVFDEPVTTAHHGVMNLSQAINTLHENTKYLPNIRIPHNVVAIPNLTQACQGATVLVFALPHQFVTKNLLHTIAQGLQLQSGHYKYRGDCRGVSLIKGGLELELELEHELNTSSKASTQVTLLSQRIEQTLSHILQTPFSCGVLMGANLANEVAERKLSECTLACNFQQHTTTLPNLNENTRLIFHSPSHFRVQFTTDVVTCEVAGALKNVYALGAGFLDALQMGSNTKAALIRIALREIHDFCRHFFPKCTTIRSDTLWESCGVADLITTCLGGRNRKCAQEFASIRKSQPQKTFLARVAREKEEKQEDEKEHLIELWNRIEKDMLHGQKLQGTVTCRDVASVMSQEDRTHFPLFYTIYKIAFLGEAIESILDGIVVVEPSIRNGHKTSRL